MYLPTGGQCVEAERFVSTPHSPRDESDGLRRFVPSREQFLKPVGDSRLVVEIADTPMPSCLDELEENAICRAGCGR